MMLRCRPNGVRPSLLWLSLLLGAALMCNVSVSIAKEQFIVNEFTDVHSQRFSHLAIDENTGSVYVGGINLLYHFDSSLNLLQRVSTGPVNDSIHCSPSGCKNWDQPTTMKLTDNYNKALLLDYTRSKLIACGTVRHGSCQIRDLRNITILTRNVSEGIVANNEAASTVAFIAPGPSNPSVTHVLYIGVTYTEKSVYRDDVPAVSSRSLEDGNFFDYVNIEVMSGTRILVNSLARELYPITYVYGFGSEKFSYFLTRQREDTVQNSPYISKLIRVCQNDIHYHSYTEIPIECKDQSGKIYNLAQAAFLGKPGTNLATELRIKTSDDVLFAVFSLSENGDKSSSKPGSENAMCVYSMKSIRRKFQVSIQQCHNGYGDRGLPFISPSYSCIETRISNIEEDFCGLDVNNPLGGKDPVKGFALYTSDTRLTAASSTSTGDDTVVFLGTATGHLKKVLIENQNVSSEYGDIVVDEGSQVRSDMFFDNAGDHLYVMTKNKISKVKAQECTIYVGCKQCLGARDPYCGWCSLENKCSLRRDCRDATQDPQHWVSYKTGRCTTITHVMPDKLQRTTARTLAILIDNLPSVQEPLQCVFSAFSKDLYTDAKRTAQGVSCTTPRNDMLPDIPQNKHHFIADLSVRNMHGREFASTNFTFFDCNTYSSCTECVSSPFPCDWCVDGHRCTHDSAENCRNDVLVTGVNRVGPSIRRGPSFCPRITFVESKEILVSSGTEKFIKVKVDNIAQFIIQTRFVCQFNIEGKVTSVNAQLLGDTLYCDIMEFTYTTAVESTNTTFAVIWGGSKPLDNPDNIHVLVYKCGFMADNCGECLSLQERYKCGWCQSTKKCEMVERCGGGGGGGGSWMDHKKTCPLIKITSFSPMSGPWEGGTNVTIKGINLGKDINDLKDGITVAGIPCHPFKESYVKTKEVTCVVENLGINEFKEGPIIIKVGNKFQGESEKLYKFVNPTITGLMPISGSMSHGTLLYIMGTDMNAGSKITASVKGRPCNVTSIETIGVLCVTSLYIRPFGKANIEMYFDNNRREITSRVFNYIDNVAPAATDVTDVQRGGIQIKIEGTNFDVLATPTIFIELNVNEYINTCKQLDSTQLSNECTVKDSTRIECISPVIPDCIQPIKSDASERKLRIKL